MLSVSPLEQYLENTELEVGCPYCGERISVLIDASAGAQQYVEDCQVCCRPIEFLLRETSSGEISVSLRTDAE